MSNLLPKLIFRLFVRDALLVCFAITFATILESPMIEHSATQHFCYAGHASWQQPVALVLCFVQGADAC